MMSALLSVHLASVQNLLECKFCWCAKLACSCANVVCVQKLVSAKLAKVQNLLMCKSCSCAKVASVQTLELKLEVIAVVDI